MTKTVALTESVHRDLKNRANGAGLTMSQAVDRLSSMADQRIKVAFNDGTVPVPDGVGIPFLSLYMGLHLMDCGVITKKVFQIILKNFDHLGDSFLTAVDYEIKEAMEYFEKLALEENYSE